MRLSTELEKTNCWGMHRTYIKMIQNYGLGMNSGMSWEGVESELL
jgi:hypothetical protein